MARLLWVDDEPEGARALARVVGDHEIDFAESGEEALSLLSERFYDLVITDLNMPPGVWGGITLLGQMKARGFNAPVIVLSGHGSQQETIMAQRLGGRDYVTKESAFWDLADSVRSVLSEPSNRLKRIRERPTPDLIADGETRTVEFKETARWNLRRMARDAEMERAVTKTVLGMANASGGTLLIGVRDDGIVTGLGPDLALFAAKRNARDAFTNWITELLAGAAGDATSASMRIYLEQTEGGQEVCRIDIPASSHPVFDASSDQESFFVRFDNSTRQLTARQAVEYIVQHWPKA